jgi:uncharacterized protein
MQFEWDENKAAVNLAKHGLSFETGALVFDDPLHQIFLDQTIDGEERWNAVGIVRGFLLVVVTHVYRGIENEEDIIRIISARPASAHERRRYSESSP